MEPRKDFTAQRIEALMGAPPPARPTIFWDGKVRGFGLRRMPSGASSYVVVRRPKGDTRLSTVTLGREGELSLKQAREAAERALATLRDGKDPNAERRAAGSVRLAQRQNSFSVVAERFIEERLKPMRSGKAEEGAIRRHLIPRWGNRPISEIETRDVVEMMESIMRDVKAERGTGGAHTARKLHAYCSQLFKWAKVRGLTNTNPVADAQQSLILPHGALVSRDHLPTDDEVKEIWRVATIWADEGPAAGVRFWFGQLVRFLLLTAVRLDEARCATWDEIDLDKAVWEIPPHRVKMKTPHVVPLTPTAVELLRSLPRQNAGPYVFSALAGMAPIAAGQKMQKCFYAELRGVRWFRKHDFRRVVRSALSSLGIAPHVSEAVLGHAARGVVAVYDRWAYLPEKRAALEKWSDRLAAITKPD